MKKQNFDKLTRAQKRVLIAKDIITQINSKNYVAKPDIFVDLSDVYYNRIGEELNKVLNFKNLKCQCCATGAIFLSQIKLFDNYLIKECHFSYWDKNNKFRYLPSIDRDFPENIFSKQQIELIEIAFENGNGVFDIGSRIRRKAAEFFVQGCDYPLDGPLNHPDYRIKKIMKNIIANNGTFKP